MLSVVLRRLAALVPTLLGVSMIIFLFLRLIPGDPATAFLRENATAQQVAEMNARLGLDRPWPEQYGRWLGRALRGDLGESLRSRIPISQEIRAKLPATAELALSAILLATLLGLPIGVVAATRRGSPVDYGSTVLGLVGVSMPVFWLGLMLIYAFAVHLGWLPPSTRGEPPPRPRTGLYVLDFALAGDPQGLRKALRHLILPAVVLGTIPLAVIARQTRSAMLEVLGQDFVRTALAKGLRHRTVVYRHALRNALLPVTTVVGLQVGVLLSGAVLTETVFSWPGMGTFVVEAIQNRDYPIVQACLLIFATIFVLVNLVVDLSYAWLDPRIRYGEP